MKNGLLISTFLLFAILFSGCPSSTTQYHQGVFPNTPINFVELNSNYDDYNSILPVVQYNQYLYFSSNRNSAGQNFDIVGDDVNVWWDMETGLLTVNDDVIYNLHFYDTLKSMINTPNNEFGPFSLNYWLPEGTESSSRYDMVTYSTNNESDNYKSKFVYHKSDGFGNNDGSFFGPFDIYMINSLQNAQYISFLREADYDGTYGENEPSQYDKMIFNASIDGNTGIFSVDLPVNDNFIEMLKSDTVISPVLITELNSDYEDKCPFVNEHLLVFSSNREGGFGGYDLYYSRFENGLWLPPVNFGADINTSYDEFRPVTIRVRDFVNDLMIFSSNRPEGKGGYDLYYVGMPFKINNTVLIIH